MLPTPERPSPRRTARENPPGARPEAPEASTGAEGPERTCVGCRGKAPQGALARLVVDAAGKVTVDHRGRGGSPGRGAWVHPTRRCLKTAAQRHAAERSLGVSVDPGLSADALVAGLKQALAQKALSLLLVSARTGTLAVGAAAVERGMEGPVALCLAAQDAGASAKVLVERVAERGVRVLTYGTKASLGSLFGRGEVALVGLRDARIAAELGATIDRLAGVED